MTIHRFSITNLLLIACLYGLWGCAPVPDNDPARRVATADQAPVEPRSANSVKAAFYNCENLFDYHRNPGKQDEDFTPDGKYHYTEQVYKQKLHNIATVLQALDEANGGELALAGLAEIENDEVLDDLCSQPELGQHHYRHICHQGPDPRGINTALLYDPALLHIISNDDIDVVFKSGGHSRPILHIYGVLSGDTTHIFVNHWTSRRNAQSESDEKRFTAATILRSYISNLQVSSPDARIIIMGDFNDNPTDASIATALNAGCNNSVAPGDLFNPFCDMYKDGEGTEKFKSEWNLFDQVIISGNWLKASGDHLHFTEAQIFNPSFISESGRNSATPKRGYKGQKWMNGYSDHYPVFISLAR